MPETQPNQVARVIAVLALVGAFLLVVVTIATSGGGSDNGGSGSDDDEDTSGITAKGERALENGVWVVGEGDTLNQIAEETGLTEDELLELNPDIDPQILTTGQRISLRSALAGDDADEDTAADDPTPSAAEAGGSGVGDDGPTGTTTTTPGSGVSDGITD